MEANTYSLWQGQGFNYLFSLLPKVHVRWVSHCGAYPLPARFLPMPTGGEQGREEQLIFILPLLRTELYKKTIEFQEDCG